MANEKLAVTMIAAAIHKRTIAEALWQEAEQDMAKAKEMMEEARRGNETDRPDREAV